jgi:hypothetical protein
MVVSPFFQMISGLGRPTKNFIRVLFPDPGFPLIQYRVSCFDLKKDGKLSQLRCKFSSKTHWKVF